MKAWIAAGCSLLIGMCASVGTASVGQERLNDACLRSVYFVDAQEGWAVGDEGVVWHSIDGGVTWERQPTGTRASLRAVHFVSPFVGWAVGREELPNGSSLGVVLATTNGGLKWTRLA
ncbi:MAG: YCF48-related protein, partial [Gemmataceae bacterium]|nr:YCF48-related protein [Gemmataceae bacterium]